MFNEDLSVLFSGPDAVTVILGGSTLKGLFDIPDASIGGGSLISTQYSLIMKTSDVSAANELDPVTVDGLSYEIREMYKMDDGLLTRLTLSSLES